MPVEVTLEFYADKSITLPHFTGYIARAIFLNMIREVNPALAVELHEANTTKPYSVAPLQFRHIKRTKDGYVLDTTQPIRVSFRFLVDGLFNYLMKYLESNSTILIAESEARIISIHIRCESYEDLQKNSMSITDFKLQFKTPTYLRNPETKYHCLFPDKRKVFLQLMKLWNTFSDRKYRDEDVDAYRIWLERMLTEAEYRLRTTMAYMGKKKSPGFLGWITYHTDDLTEWSRVTYTLAKFAEYANIGGNRTGGFGVVKFTPRTTEKK